MSLPIPESPPVSASAAFAMGMRSALTSVLIFVAVGTFLGVGALAHDLGFSIAWTLSAVVLIWAAPAQVILMTALAGGSPWIEIALAVALSAVRLLPMTVSLVPLMRGAATRLRDLVVAAHFVSVTTWALSLSELPQIARERRIAFVNGMGVGFTLIAVASAIGGYLLAASLPVPLAAALLFLTPLAFLIMTANSARSLVDRLALAFGLAIGPILSFYRIGLDLLWTGLIAGTLAYAAHRLLRAVRPDVRR